MNKEQEKDLFIEWALYEPSAHQALIDEYFAINRGNYSKNSFLEFLKLEIEGYWKGVGLA